jgi:hypothetical protein
VKIWKLEENKREKWTSIVEEAKILRGPWSQGVSMNPMNPTAEHCKLI